MIARGDAGARCAVCDVPAAAHEACSTCFVARATEQPLFVRRAHGIKICGHCRAQQRELGIEWNDRDFATGGIDDVALDERRTIGAVPLRDAMKPQRRSGRPRDRSLDALVLPLLFNREKVEIVSRRTPRRRTWTARKRGRYICGECQRRGHNRRSCDGAARRRAARRGTYVRRGWTSRREIARLAGCAQMSVDRRYHELFRANFTRPLSAKG